MQGQLRDEPLAEQAVEAHRSQRVPLRDPLIHSDMYIVCYSIRLEAVNLIVYVDRKRIHGVWARDVP